MEWLQRLAEKQVRILWFIPFGLFCVFLGSQPFPDNPLRGFVLRSQEHSVNAPLLAQARQLNLEYGQVLSDLKQFTGKPVVWCVDSFDGQTGFVGGRQSQAIVWTEPSPALKSEPASHGYCLKMLSVVVGGNQVSVSLRPVEQL